MNNSTVSKALHDLEQGLKEIESARNQVVLVTDQGRDIITAFKSVLVKLKSIQEDLDTSEKQFSNSINTKIQTLSKSANKAVERIAFTQASNEEKLESGLQNSLKVLSDFEKRITDLSEESKALQIRLSDLDIKGVIEKVQQDYSAQLVAQIVRLKSELDKIQKENATILNSVLENFGKSFENRLNMQIRRFNWLIVISIVGFCSLAGLIIFK